MVSRPARQSATKTADKNNGGQARQNNGGQALDLLTIALKTDSNKPNENNEVRSSFLTSN